MDDDFQPLLERSCFRHFLDQVGAVEQNSCKGIVDLMCDARSHSAQTGELVRLDRKVVVLNLLFLDEASLVNGYC